MTYHCRPSEMLGIDDEWAAYQFDVAAYTVGQTELNRQQRAANGHGSNQAGGQRDAAPMSPEMMRAMAVRK